MLNESDIQKLLRLKRHEQPPPQYFDQFLRDFQRRQRAELLRQPAWKIALERVEAFFSLHSMGRYAYGAATASVLFVAGITSFNILNTGGPVTTLASNNSPNPTLSHVEPSVPSPLVAAQVIPASQEHPRYVIDTRPASYERSLSF